MFNFCKSTFERKKKYYKTGKTITVDDFNKEMAEKHRGEFKDLALKLHAFEKKAVDIIDKLPVFTFNAFEKNYYTNRGTKDTIAAAFIDQANHFGAQGQIGTAVSYECAQKSLDTFSPQASFSDITPAFLHKYEAWMISKNRSITTISFYLRSLRALFNT